MQLRSGSIETMDADSHAFHSLCRLVDLINATSMISVDDHDVLSLFPHPVQVPEKNVSGIDCVV